MGKTFKENLREMLDFHDITVKELAFKTGISKRSIENYLNTRESMPPADYACKIARALNTTVEQLVTGDAPQIQQTEDFSRITRNLKKLSQDDLDSIGQIVSSLAKVHA